RPHAGHGLHAACCRPARGFVNCQLLEFGDSLRQPIDLLKANARQLHNQQRKRRRFALDLLRENFHIRWPLRRHDAMLGQMTAQRVDELRALAHQNIPGPEKHRARLLVLGLDLDEAHGRPACRLRNRLGVGGVVLRPLDERFDIGGWDQPNLVAKGPYRPAPVMRAPASLHGDDAARPLGKESENLLSRQLLAEPHPAIGQGAARLKSPLCKVETDNANLFHGCLLRSWHAQTSPPWHITMPSRGGIHSITFSLRALEFACEAEWTAHLAAL